ncbi:hypothetical protein FOZ63_021395 [Perkinsus olseni]|uniref:Uncharacterized protein n=1 Tax=Perkinsus olseni TaxID=32597 RepID=A0A7J6S051_PEROL|nr:hypothetical protein FOZ63_021395 [Perkinsus olseni]KAF4725935.1 hypothetical protein FOZ62_023921 [Perkinsus olseni]
MSMKFAIVTFILLVVSVAIIVQKDEFATNDVKEFDGYIEQDDGAGDHYQFGDHAVGRSLQSSDVYEKICEVYKVCCDICTEFLVISNKPKKYICTKYVNNCRPGFTSGDSVDGGGAVIADGTD